MRIPRLPLVSLMILTMSSLAHGTLSATFNNGTARYGTCLKPLSAPASQILSQYGVRVGSAVKGRGKNVRPTNGTDEDLANTTAMILQRVKDMGGTSVLSAVRNLKVWSVSDLDISGRYTGQGLCLHSSNAKNFALVAHELGHRVGNSFAYTQYKRAVKSRCTFTKYSTAEHGNGARNEEFAEVFAAYITNPNLLKNGSPACQQAYEFLKQTLFKNTPNDCEAGSGEGSSDGHTLDDCDSPNDHQNHKDIQDAADAAEISAHVQENEGGLITQFADIAPVFLQMMLQRNQGASSSSSSALTQSILTPASSSATPTAVGAPASSGTPAPAPIVENPGDAAPYTPPTQDSVIRTDEK